MKDINQANVDKNEHSDVEQFTSSEFWSIKRGVKVSGMPDWCPSHDD
jgi:hypothetical protein